MPLLLIRLSCVLASGDSSEGWEGQMSNERSRVSTRRRFLGTAAGVTGALCGERDRIWPGGRGR